MNEFTSILFLAVMLAVFACVFWDRRKRRPDAARVPITLIVPCYNDAITEDVDLAFKLSKAGWRVEQSFRFIRTHVPSRWSAWLRQKVRWTAGGFQCIFRYPAI